MIDKVSVEKGAIFDYEQIVAKTEMDIKDFKNFLELKLKNVSSQEPRIEYFDKKSGKRLLLFLRRGYDFGIMRVWILEGICEKCDYSPVLEQRGLIREWLNVIIE